MKKHAALYIVASLAIAACAVDEPQAPGDITAAPQEGTNDGARFNACAATFHPSPASSWRHWTSRFISALGGVVHAASDVVVRPGNNASLQAKFAYGGVLQKDLEDEWIWVFVNDCSAWRYVGYAKTDGDGRATFTLASGLTAGRYEVRMEVVGDATVVPLTLWVLPTGTHVSVFDIDGTLTTDDGELFEEILLGWVPEAYPGAVDVVWAERARNEVVVYLTGRPEVLAGHTRRWLSGLGFPPGAVKLAPRTGDILPTNSGVGSYKAAYLKSLTAAGLKLDDAFGNATTDVYAYKQAAIRTDRTWIIGPNAGSGGTKPVTDSWDAVADQLFSEPPVTQPF